MMLGKDFFVERKGCYDGFKWAKKNNLFELPLHLIWDFAWITRSKHMIWLAFQGVQDKVDREAILSRMAIVVKEKEAKGEDIGNPSQDEIEIIYKGIKNPWEIELWDQH